MNTVLDSLFLRRPKLEYISPPICEAVFSGSGSPVIILPEIGKLIGPTGLELSGRGSVRLSWNRYPGALCYNVYSAVLNVQDILEPCSGLVSESATLTYQLLFECIVDPFVILPTYGCYRISAITGEGETDLSDPVCTCAFTPSCPAGQHWDPIFFECVCDSQNCPDGQTWDPIACVCVPCGTQHCPGGFAPDPTDGCTCIPNGGPPPTQVCNEEQTASCTAPATGTPVTIAAGTFCRLVYNATPERVAQAQTELNAQALAEAKSELSCVTPGYKICDWLNVKSQLTGFGACSASADPEWDGTFDHVTEAPAVPGSKLWYFVSKAIAGASVSADHAPDYPAGDWQDVDCFVQLFFNPDTSTWDLFFSCADNCSAPFIWNGTMSSTDPDDASGTYTRDTGTGPDTIVVKRVDAICCPDWSKLQWGSASHSDVGGGSSNFIPDSGTGGDFTVSADAPDGSSSEGRIFCTGTVRFGGGGVCNCNLHVDMTKISTPSTNTGFTTGHVIVNYTADGGFPLAVLTATFGTTPSNTGNFDFPFSIPDFGPGVLSVQAFADAPQFPIAPPGHQAINLVCSLTTV